MQNLQADNHFSGEPVTFCSVKYSGTESASGTCKIGAYTSEGCKFI